MNLYMVFYNKNGNKKLVLDLRESTISDMALSNIIKSMCETNQYTFTYVRDIDESYRNIPIIKAEILIQGDTVNGK